MTSKKGRAIVAIAAMIIAVGVSSLDADVAGAYTTSSNWYSKTWWFNKSETYRVAWVEPNPALAIKGVIGMPTMVQVALNIYGYSFKWIAQQARSRNGCLSIYWQYVNLPVPQMYWGPSCT